MRISFKACLAALIVMKEVGPTGMFNSMHDQIEPNELDIDGAISF